jgi:hypothetical protein
LGVNPLIPLIRVQVDTLTKKQALLFEKWVKIIAPVIFLCALGYLSESSICATAHLWIKPVIFLNPLYKNLPQKIFPCISMRSVVRVITFNGVTLYLSNVNAGMFERVPGS